MMSSLVTVEIIAASVHSFFLPFRICHLSHIKKLKKKSAIGQRIDCCGFVNFLGASRMLMNFLGFCFMLRTEVVVVGIGG